METGFRFGFVLVALGFAAGALAGAWPAESGRERLGHLPTLLIGAGAAILGGALTLWVWAAVQDLAVAARFEPFSLARGLVPAAIGAVAVGLAGGFAAPGVGRWTWGLLASLALWYLAGALWLFLLVGPEVFESARVFAQDEGIESGEVLRSIWTFLVIITGYPVVTLLGATGGATGGAALAGSLGHGRPKTASVPDSLLPGTRLDEADVAPDRTDASTWHFVRVAGGSYRVFDGAEEVTLLEMMPWAHKGGFELEGGYYRIDAGLLSRSLTLETMGRHLARADVGLARRSARIAFGDRELSLHPGFALAPVLGTLFLKEAGQPIGRLESRRSPPTQGVAELPRDLPLLAVLFTIYIALVLWRRWSVSEA